MTTGLKANSDGSAAIQVGGSDAITITSGLNTTFVGTVAVAGSTTALYPLVSGTAVASTSGTSIDFTGIPSTAKRITVMFDQVSGSGTSPFQIQLGSGTIATTGYLGNVWEANTSNVNISSGFQLRVNNLGTNTISGTVMITLLNAATNIWTAIGSTARTANADICLLAGSKTLAGTLDRVRITAVNGTDTFDAGTINIMWE